MKLHEALATGKRCRRPGWMGWITGAASHFNGHEYRYPAVWDNGAHAVVDLSVEDAVNTNDWYCEGDPSGIHSPFHRDVFGGVGWDPPQPTRCHPEAHKAVDTGMRKSWCSRCDANLLLDAGLWIEAT